MHLRNERLRALLGGALIALAAARGALAQAATVTLLDYKTAVPSGWTSRVPSSTMRLAEYTADGAEIVVYFFGQGQGGNVAANLARWKSQFSTTDGSPVPEVITRDSTGAFPMTLLSIVGRMRAASGRAMRRRQSRGRSCLPASPRRRVERCSCSCSVPAANVSAQRDAFDEICEGAEVGLSSSARSAREDDSQSSPRRRRSHHSALNASANGRIHHGERIGCHVSAREAGVIAAVSMPGKSSTRDAPIDCPLRARTHAATTSRSFGVG